jgi:hypothetical protein
MNKTWKIKVAGILEILAGLVMLVNALNISVLILLEAQRPWEKLTLGLVQFVSNLLLLLLPFITVLLGIALIVGGVYAIQRRKWRLAFVSAIATVPFILMTPWGVGATMYRYDIAMHYFIWLPLLLWVTIITLLVLSKREFK